ncbi:MAG: type IX secretion system outer membrane channel protein PorV, partial [Bacteroidaceae bacterium]|nr:type IX secretion system outer membrane channel protein PorV [Bacteroidaceae bacterium]
MKTRTFQHRLLLLVALVLAVGSLRAQDKKNMFNPVNTSVTSLSIAPDARGGAMGDVGAATEADVNSQYWNPAKYPFNIARAGASVSYTPWLRKLVNDINLANLVGFYRIGDYSAVHGSLRFFSLGEVYLSDMEDMTINPYEFAFDLGYSRMLSECFSMAVNMRFIYSDIKYDYTAESSAGKAFAADIAMYRLGYFMAGNRECSFGWGLNINNIGSKITYGGDDDAEFIPTNLRLGLNLTIPFNEYNKFSVATDVNKLLVPTYPKQKDGEADNDYTDRVQKDYYDISPISG